MPTDPAAARATARATALWRASELCTQRIPVLPSGHEPLDAALPGGGWPLGVLIDLLQPAAGQHEWRLLLPALARSRGAVVLVGCPQLPHMAALGVQGLLPQHVLQVQADTPAQRLWAAEQALHCHELGALLVWLPQVAPMNLRRLQLAARAVCATDDRPPPLVLALRPAAARFQACAAPLRLLVQGRGLAGLSLHIFKRQGPPLAQPLMLPVPLPVLNCLRRPSSAGAAESVPSHVVDRLRPAVASSIARAELATA